MADRLISKDAIIATIKDEGLCGSGFSSEERENDIIRMIESCPEVEVPDWISVDERLPADGEIVLAYIKHNYIEDGWSAYRVYEYKGYFKGMGNLCEVTHWMHLPKLPKEAQQ